MLERRDKLGQGIDTLKRGGPGTLLPIMLYVTKSFWQETKNPSVKYLCHEPFKSPRHSLFFLIPSFQIVELKGVPHQKGWLILWQVVSSPNNEASLSQMNPIPLEKCSQLPRNDSLKKKSKYQKLSLISVFHS